MLVQQADERILVRRILIADILFCLDFRIEFQLLEQKHAYLLGRQNVQRRLTGICPDAVLNLRELRRERIGVAPKLVQIDLHPLYLHLREHPDKRLFNPVVKPRQAERIHVLPHAKSERKAYRRFPRTVILRRRGSLVKKRKLLFRLLTCWSVSLKAHPEHGA